MPLFVLALSLLSAASARADRHAADSGPAVVDVRPPVVAITAPAGGETFYGLEEHILSWSLQETHHLAGGHSASVLGNGQPVSSATFPDADGPHAWTWTVPDVSSGTAVLAVAVTDSFGNTTVAESESFRILLADTGAGEAPPAATALTGARPNPFNPATSVDFALAGEGRALITVHDLRGRTVRTLLDRDLGAGRWTARWDGRDDDGRALPAAAYLVRLRHAGRDAGVRKVVLLP